MELCEFLSCCLCKGNHVIPPAILPGVSWVQRLRDDSPSAGQTPVRLSLTLVTSCEIFLEIRVTCDEKVSQFMRICNEQENASPQALHSLNIRKMHDAEPGS